MKKFLCMIMAVVASLSVVAFATACEDGKCDECKTTENVKVYETKDDEKMELCPKCYAEKVADNVLGGLLG